MSVHDNFIQRTSKPGIFVQQVNASGVQEGPSSDVTITNNVVDSAINYGGPSIGPIVAAASIHSVTENDQAAQVTPSPHSNIVVTRNRVTNSSRTAIRLENVNGGEISGNVIQGYGLEPSTNVYIIPVCCETMAQYVADFMRAILLTNTIDVTRSDNSIDTEGALSIRSHASGVPKIAGGSIALATGADLSSTTAVSVIDSAGVTWQADVVSASDSAVVFLVPDGIASGIASVSIGGQSGGVLIDTVAPGLYSADGTGQGVARADAVLIGADGTTTAQTVFVCAAAGGGCVASPLELGANDSDQLQITLQGAGFRGFSGAANVAARIGGSIASVVSIGSGPELGVDRVQLIVPRSLAGAGAVSIVLTVDGQTANVVRLLSDRARCWSSACKSGGRSRRSRFGLI